MKPEEFVERRQAENGPPDKRWLTADMDFKMGVGYVRDPKTGEQFGNWVSDWYRSEDGWILEVFFRLEDVNG